ncbi:MAG: hypothetical protein FWC21_01545 [Treponema sp.]|nr:hypothetical protein [Treponema sp.]
MKKIIFIFFIAFLTALSLSAEESGVSSTSELFLQISTLPEAKLGYRHSFIFPAFQGSSPMTSGNNLRLGLTAEISPISLNGIVQAELTPVAFLKFAAGLRLGAGWPLKLFESDLYGTGLNLFDINMIRAERLSCLYFFAKVRRV